MLVIRKEQITVLEEYSQKGFERELAAHITEFAPRHCAAIGNDAVREFARQAIERAEKHGFTNRGPVRFYAEMMCLFGSDFDTDGQLPWVQEVLQNEMLGEQTERADALFDRMQEYDKAVTGPEKKYYLKALENLSKIKFEDYDLKRLDDEVKRGLERIYPQKCQDLGIDGLNALIARGKHLAEESSVTSERGVALFIALAFILGHGFRNDPFFPWIANTMDKDKGDPNEKAERVFNKMKLYLDEALKA